ncbi:MAG: hypothetical protein EHM47_14280 [Ignavibacteriales bacterium]|nr:MAG: hypothetical protein EHM47_14280 [Ignavibacteriales bacterium]
MSVSGANEKIQKILREWSGLTTGTHRFGGIAFNFGKREIGHTHGNSLVDIPFPMKIRNEVIGKGEAVEHHVLPESGWVSVHLEKEKDIDNTINLLRRSYELAVIQKKKSAV